ncbi:MAG: hypothetical protein AB8V23_02655 [Candidatus Midichloria sp.]|uniref:FG-GAP repeat-containing protein n=1 Tax=Hyalomma marginatum TaxID=34627 RepID=A0A8S4C3C8_9ACAR|nr:FG-GAP repeat-containing protein [Hyalomma marginatum]CAG7598638.1 FG-GAP repeat-containing protein [Hyalomma marginatum]
MTTNGIFELSELTSSTGMTINGIEATGQAGISVNSAGEVNGDD